MPGPEGPPPHAAAGSIRWHNAVMPDNDAVTEASASGAERIEVQRTIHADPSRVFAVLRDPQGHVTIDSSGMLQDATGDPASKVGDEFVVHMDREALNDYPMGKYDVTVTITKYEPDREIAWTILGQIRPQIGHVYGYRLEPAEGGTLVTSYYDWSDIDPQWREAGIFPVISETALRATLGILDRTLARSTQW
jgi:uncharacterized protein YndB with AHSA1/START domain